MFIFNLSGIIFNANSIIVNLGSLINDSERISSLFINVYSISAFGLITHYLIVKFVVSWKRYKSKKKLIKLSKTIKKLRNSWDIRLLNE